MNAQEGEELQGVLPHSPRYIERLPDTTTMAAERPVWALLFRTSLRQPILTHTYIEDEAGRPLEIILVDADSGLPATIQQALPVELVPLFADFPPEGRVDWSAAEFQQGVVKERGKHPLLAGDVSLTVRDGRASAADLWFTDKSSWVRGQKLRIGARVLPGSYDGPRILEAGTEAFVVRHYREELYREHYPRDLGKPAGHGQCIYMDQNQNDFGVISGPILELCGHGPS